MEANTQPNKHEQRIKGHKEKNLEVNETKHKPKSSKKIFIILISIAIIVSIIYSVIAYSSKPGQYDAFAKCLSEKGFKMYGADWCPNCKTQKKMFGKSFKYEGYPTWIYNEEKYVGVQSLSRLSSITDCPLNN